MMPVKNPACFFKIIVVLAVAAVSGLYFPTPAPAQDKSILISPTRVVFEGRKRSATVKMINPNPKPYTFKIGLVAIRSDEYGVKKEAELPDENELFAQKLIRFSPRRVTLPPDGWQTIRLMVRKPQDLAPGEYRTQLKVSTIPEKEHPESKGKNTGIAINIDIVFNVSIPVILRHGKVDVTVVPRAPRFITKDGQAYLETTLERHGLYSVFADVTAFFTPQAGEKQRIRIGEKKSVSIYSQNTHQVVYMPLKDKDVLTRGNIEIEVMNREDKKVPLLGSGSFEFK